MKRIYLEHHGVLGSSTSNLTHLPVGGHLYLVIREEGSNDPQNTEIIAGNKQGSNLIAQVMGLQNSFDFYLPGEGPFTHRHALDITSTIFANSGFATAEQAWTYMQGVASTIGSTYKYHAFDVGDMTMQFLTRMPSCFRF